MGVLCLLKNTLKSNISHLKQISVISVRYKQCKHGSHLLWPVVYSEVIDERLNSRVSLIIQEVIKGT